MRKVHSSIFVARQDEWNKALSFLSTEKIKLMSYDKILIPLLGQVRGKRILDYGAGPGVLASLLARKGANVKAWDVNPKMRQEAAQRLGKENIYNSLEEIPERNFDIIICNLVLCIVSDEEVKNIIANMQRFLRKDGKVFIGFCNPLIYNVAESQLNSRFITNDSYLCNHCYRKIKKEGNYEIIEQHRPLGWYERIMVESGLQPVMLHFTAPYDLPPAKNIRDFVIFELTKHS